MQRLPIGILLIAFFCTSVLARPVAYTYQQKKYSPVLSFNLNPQDVLNRSFRLASRENRPERLRDLLKEGAQIDSASDKGETALMYASRRCSYRSAKWLLRNGANPNARDKKGRTALIHASRSPCPSIVRLLVSHKGVNVLHRDRSGRDALSYFNEAASMSVDGPMAKALSVLKSAASRAQPPSPRATQF